MILEKITKGNFNLEFTKKTYKHENNLRFHVKIDERLPTIAYNALSGPERQESLIQFLGKFSCTDNIPKIRKGDVEHSSGTESSSDSESE